MGATKKDFDSCVAIHPVSILFSLFCFPASIAGPLGEDDDETKSKKKKIAADQRDKYQTSAEELVTMR